MKKQKKINSKSGVIYIFPYAPTAFDAKKFGFDYLLESNINFQVFDLSALISSRTETGDVYLRDSYIKKILTYAALEEAIKKTVNHSVYIDGVNGLNGFQWQGRRIYRLFKKYKVHYYAVEVGSLPILHAAGPKSLINRLKKMLNFKKLRAYVRWRAGKAVVYWQWKYLRLYQLPAKIFAGNSDIVEHYLKKYHIAKSNVVPIHSFDYDCYLAYLRQPPTSSPVQKPYCVFLDQMLATHTDFGKNVSFIPVTAANYLPRLKQFFDTIEKKTGLQVVIAASPRSQYEKTPEIFGNRLVIKDKTLELVADSSLVLLHTTTAVSFAILFDKPVLFLKTREMENAPGFGNLLQNMANLLNQKPLCIDDNSAVEQAGLDNLTSWKKDYDSYKYKYVKTKNVSDRLTWEILLGEL